MRIKLNDRKREAPLPGPLPAPSSRGEGEKPQRLLHEFSEYQ